MTDWLAAATAQVQVIICSACSGHGFKFCSAIGEILADLVTTGRTAHQIATFAMSRFAKHSKL